MKHHFEVSKCMASERKVCFPDNASLHHLVGMFISIQSVFCID